MIGSLNQKLLRDTWNIKGQMAAIVLVMAAGIAIFILTFGVLDSLRLTRDTYYDRYQFADIFAGLKRAPESVIQRVEEIPGVSIAESRVIFGVTLQMPGLNEPASGKILSLPDGKDSRLNNLYLRSGRMLYPSEEDAVLAGESFFNAHQLKIGDQISVIMNGHLRLLKVVGVVLSPEYVYSMAPGALMPDDKRYGVFWMSRRALEAAVNMKGAFNDIAIKVERNADLEVIKNALDHILKPYGGLIAYGREEQISNFFVENELVQLESMGLLAPIIFLSVAAFLINVVMSRQIATQREQIGMLKAVGYTDWEISAHFLKMVIVVCIVGSLAGLAFGTWMGAGMTKMYTEFFHFPILKYSFSAEVMIFAVMFCFTAAVAGTLFAIRSAANLPPAEAMRAESPTVFKPTIIERLGLHQQLSFLSRIILRQLERRPIRGLLSAIGMALALSILIFSFFMEDSMDFLMDAQYDLTQREDVNFSFVEPVSLGAIEALKVIPGVLAVEPFRRVAVNFKFENFSKRSAITGYVKNADLHRIIDDQLIPLTLPESGLVFSQTLANILHLQVGDFVEAEVLEGQRQVLQVPIVNITPEFIGIGAYMAFDELNRILDSSPKISGAMLQVDKNYEALVYNRLKQIPSIMGLNIVSKLRQIFEELMAENLLKMVAINVLFASFISFGVIYNTARISLSERGRELANLRVLGFTRREVAYILFGELGVVTVFSIPLGIWFGNILASSMTTAMQTELYRIPFVINNNTYGYAVSIVLVSAAISFYLVWWQIDRIDLVSAQKGVE